MLSLCLISTNLHLCCFLYRQKHAAALPEIIFSYLKLFSNTYARRALEERPRMLQYDNRFPLYTILRPVAFSYLTLKKALQARLFLEIFNPAAMSRNCETHTGLISFTSLQTLTPAPVEPPVALREWTARRPRSYSMHHTLIRADCSLLLV